MEFRVLGPLEVVADDAPIEVPGAKPRALLGLLLVHANRVVSADRLVEELWEGAPPRSPGATLQTYVHRLRQALRLDSLRTRAGGYVLEVKDSDLDALRFERAVREVSTIENASPRHVATRLGEALAWWRGKALADFEGAAWARPHTDRLEELRLGALEELVEARLALGEHGVLVPELEMLVSQHPLRERLWEHLILALYRCDRQAEALRAYQRVRTTLAEELGLEPGPELVDLERRIFDHDATLVAPLADAGEGAALGRDREEPGVGLPSPPTSFVGRSADLDEVTGLLDGHRLVTLTGAGGCGKTRLAIEVASRLADGFIDGVRFADLAAVTAGAQVGEAVVGALGLDHDPNRDPVARLAAHLGERAILCVLDNCEHLLDACAALAEAVVTRGDASRLLATSREPLGIAGEQVYVVPSLDVGTEAVCLFADRGGEARAGFVVDDVNRATVTDICRRLDGIPLAIELAAARTAHLWPTQLLERLDDRFALLRAERRIPRHQTLTATLDWSYELLDVREREVLRGLAVFPASFTLEAAEAVVGEDAVEVLGSLVAKSLIQVDHDVEQLGYRLLETVRLYARGRLAPAEADACRTRHRDWVVGWLADVPLEQRWWGDTDPSAPIYTDVRAALDWSAAQGDTEMVARLTAGTDIWRRRVQRREAIHWLEEAVAPGDALPAELQLQLCVMISSLRSVTAQGVADWADIAHWSQRAIDAAGGRASPLLPQAVAFRATAAAVTAVEARDESQVDPTTELVEACVAMGEQLLAPWRMTYRLHAGLACSTLATAWPRYTEVARRHFAAGVAVALPAPPYVGLHAELSAQLALHTFLVGDGSRACVIARETQASTARTRRFAPDIPLVLALLAAYSGASTPDMLLAELHRYHGRIQDNDNRPEAAEPVVLYGGFVAAMHEDWDLASRLLAAGERSVYRNPSHAHLYLHFRRRVRDALGPERSRQLRDEGRAMPLADALAAALGSVAPVTGGWGPGRPRR